MEYSDLRGFLDESVEFPITHDSLVGQLDGVEITAPTGGSIPVDEVLNRVGEPSYESSEVLYATLVGNLDDRFIGRKYSDGRGGAHTCPDPKCPPQQSF
jgi:hypothetical protein